jgi:hypothetical protein
MRRKLFRRFGKEESGLAAVGGEVLTTGLDYVGATRQDGLMWLNKAGQRGALPGWLYFAGRIAKAAPQACKALQNF